MQATYFDFASTKISFFRSHGRMALLVSFLLSSACPTHFTHFPLTLCLDGWILERVEKFEEKIGEKMRKGVVW